MPTGYLRISFMQGLLAALQTVAAPIVCVAVLFGVTQLTGVTFNDEYVALAVIAALLTFIFLRGQMGRDWGTFISGWTIMSRVALAWIGVLGMLLLLGYATRISAEFSRINIVLR